MAASGRMRHAPSWASNCPAKRETGLFQKKMPHKASAASLLGGDFFDVHLHQANTKAFSFLW